MADSIIHFWQEGENPQRIAMLARDNGDGTFSLAADPMLMAKLDQLATKLDTVISLLSAPLDVSLV